jgi:hypothetical protein
MGVNFKAAKRIGLTILPNVLAWADKLFGKAQGVKRSLALAQEKFFNLRSFGRVYPDQEASGRFKSFLEL